ncbi:MAG: HsdM family class I SAM-dependent methyltransferase [Christensenellales bacterium]|jgi:type I restriction-modification system DNA methylase subunit
MQNPILKDVLNITVSYLQQNYSGAEIKSVNCELQKIFDSEIYSSFHGVKNYSYEMLQAQLSSINEKESIRKSKGVYYTPSDVVEFMLANCARLSSGKLKPNNLHIIDLHGIPYIDFCYEKTVFDPTCGAGEFLLATLNKKFDLLELHHATITKGKIHKVLKTIKGNDLNPDSVVITKVRLFLCILYRFGPKKIEGTAEIMKGCFDSYDFIMTEPNSRKKYDIIIGNPPYVEDSKSGLNPPNKYGNIYANVLENSSLHLKKGGVIGFIIPLSYVSTPRMKRIRKALSRHITEQYILSYSDRPDCLFASVHQKLCLLFGRNNENVSSVFTSNYRYWYKEERKELFDSAVVVKNNFLHEDYIPKIGSQLDVQILSKISKNNTQLIDLLEVKEGETPIYVNMRATFWIKAFIDKHNSGEYKQFKCLDFNHANLCMCLLNSSLFWWYWVCISDCWHLTRKELIGFKVPDISVFSKINELAILLEKKLEETKVYVNTKQTDYEYKHKECVEEIHAIDDYINNLYGLTDEESLYIKNFAFRYRVGGGVVDEGH